MSGEVLTTPEQLVIRTSREDGVERLTPIGELDIATVPILEALFEVAFGDSAARMIVVDLTELSFIDSSGLNLLLRMRTACEEDDRLRVVNGSPAVTRLLDVSGIRPLLPIISSGQDPLEPLSPAPRPGTGT